MRPVLRFLPVLLAIVALGCKADNRAAYMMRLSPDEKAVLGDWAIQSDPLPGGKNMGAMFSQAGQESDEPPILKLEVDKSFALSAMESSVTGSWRCENGAVRLTIEKVDGRPAADVMREQSQFENSMKQGSMPSGTDFRESFKKLMQGVLLSCAEAYRELKPNPDKSELTASAAMPEMSALMGFGKSLKKKPEAR